MPFVKVVEDQEIYNFGMGHFGHYSSNFWRKTRSKNAKWKWFRLGAPELCRATSARHPVHAPAVGPPGPGCRGIPVTVGSPASHRRPRANIPSPHAASPRVGQNRLTPAAARHWPAEPSLAAQPLPASPYPAPCRRLVCAPP
jgi:hypothetical protein